ncbi:hypothetical protein EV187_0794 [Agromyces ramosus]|uniref:Uncharacterized protein n=2 Tax=Agromyces ramosus TaxID=33879 RepID=A0A4Q7MJ31_9MICO|nr:hypothetical protein EV187_0794 [Agromyces ramosus]
MLLSSAVVGVLFRAPWGFVLLAVTLVGSALAMTVLFRAVTGRARWIASIMLALLPPAGVWRAIIGSGRIPFDTVYGMPAALAIGGAVGSLSMLALPGRWRFAGAVSAVLIATPLLIPVFAHAAERAAAEERAQRASVEQAFDGLVDPLGTDLAGTTITLTSASTDAAQVAVDRDGRELVILTTPTGGSGPYDPDAFACWRLVGTESSEGDETMAEFADRCVVVDGGWATIDGSVVGTNVGTRWVQVEAGAGATPDDVMAVFHSLEEFPEERVRAWFDEHLMRDRKGGE